MGLAVKEIINKTPRAPNQLGTPKGRPARGQPNAPAPRHANTRPSRPPAGARREPGARIRDPRSAPAAHYGGGAGRAARDPGNMAAHPISASRRGHQPQDQSWERLGRWVCGGPGGQHGRQGRAGGALRELFVLRTLKKNSSSSPTSFVPHYLAFSPSSPNVQKVRPPLPEPHPASRSGQARGQRAWAARGRSVRNHSQLGALPSPNTHSGKFKELVRAAFELAPSWPAMWMGLAG